MFRKIFLNIIAGLWLGVISAASSAQQEAVQPTYQSAREIPMEVFAQLPKIEEVSISPNGRYLAIVYPVQGEAKFTIFDLAKENPDPPKVINTGEAEIVDIYWVSNDRVLIKYGFYAKISKKKDAYLVRMMAFDRDGGNAIKVGDFSRSLDAFGVRISQEASNFYVNTSTIVSMLPDDPEHILVHVEIPGLAEYGVYKVNVYNNEMKNVVKPMKNISGWYADHEGNVRFATAYRNGRMIFMTRETANAPWKEFTETKIYDETDFTPLYFGWDTNTLFVRTSLNTGKNTIYEFDLEKGQVRKKLFEHPYYDVERLILSDARQKVLAATYTDDYPTLHYFDEEYKKMRQKIEAALLGMRISIIDSTPDERFYVIRSYSSTDPGGLYIFDSESGELSPIWDVMPGLDASLMSEVKRVSYLARDGLEIIGYLTIPKGSDGKNLPTVLMVHGGPWARDDMVFNEEVQFLASRGYVVFQPNFRGSSGFGERFKALGYGEWGRKMQNDLADAVYWMVDEGIADPDRICILGGSYGGYAALMGVALDPDLYQCAFAFAPLTDLYYLIQKAKDKDYWHSFLKKAVAATKKATQYNRMAPIKHVKKIQVPVLLIHGDKDSTVNIKHSKKMAKALKKAKKDYQFIILEGAGHGLFEEKDRLIYFGKLEEFLAENLGPGATGVPEN